ncbi:MAG: phosphoribosylformylglycinamidine cyclo-ligase [Alphaproteobacteria bacterium]|nr:phosphoribosylformylglycinamidine cyclo-ligase [Alphaproteobacteria bacterium]
MSDKYASLGVSSSKEAVHRATRNNSKGLFPYAFCKIDSYDYSPKWLNNIAKLFGHRQVGISHADGAGTKTSLAYIYWKETGDMSVWRGVVQDSIAMNIDDVACVGGLTGRMFLTSSIDRNSHRIPDEVIAELINGENIFLDMLRAYEIDITGQSGETADVSDLVRTVTVNNSLFCQMPYKNVIDNANIKPGNFIVGLSSDGCALYESKYNGGMGSNGLTLGRHGVFAPEYRKKYPESFESLIDAGSNGVQSYTGTKKLDEKVNAWGVSYGEMVLSPTRTYAPVIKKYHDLHLDREISGMVHCSGGGQTKVLNYLSNPMTVTKYDMFDIPQLFNIIQKESGQPWEHMYKTFNMGHRMEIYTPSKDAAEKMIDVSKSFGVEAKIIGCVERGAKRLLIKSPHGRFEYSR